MIKCGCSLIKTPRSRNKVRKAPRFQLVLGHALRALRAGGPHRGGGRVQPGQCQQNTGPRYHQSRSQLLPVSSAATSWPCPPPAAGPTGHVPSACHACVEASRMSCPLCVPRYLPIKSRPCRGGLPRAWSRSPPRWCLITRTSGKCFRGWVFSPLISPARVHALTARMGV